MKRTTFSIKENQNFIDGVLNQDLLDCAVVWIVDNLLPEDVFDPGVLSEWAFENGFRKFE